MKSTPRAVSGEVWTVSFCICGIIFHLYYLSELDTYFSTFLFLYSCSGCGHTRRTDVPPSLRLFYSDN